MTVPTSKLSLLIEAIEMDDWTTVFRIAARFPSLGEHRTAIVRAHEALVRPDFYREIGKDVEMILIEGKAAIYARYGAQLAKRKEDK